MFFFFFFVEVLSDSHEEYGSIVKLWLNPKQLLVSIKEPEIIKEMLLKAKDKLPLTGKAFNLAFGRSTLFASSFDKVLKLQVLLTLIVVVELFKKMVPAYPNQ